MALNDIVARYNEEHTHSSLEGKTPGDVYRERMRRSKERRSGRDILALVAPQVTTITTGGTVHFEGRRVYRFAYEADGIMLGLGTRITYRPDPALRGLFAEAKGHKMFLEPLAKWAAAQNPADVARQQRAAATLAADQAAITRKEEDAKVIGLSILDRVDAAAASTQASAPPADEFNFGDGDSIPSAAYDPTAGGFSSLISTKDAQPSDATEETSS